MLKNKPTVNEHFIPQFYLRSFTMDGERLYQYDVISNKQTLNPVSIQSICYKKNLYEFTDNSGNFINRNLIETCFGKFEGEFANVFHSILSKANNNANYQTLCFLSTKEKSFLIFFISTLILRNPDIINIAQQTAFESINKNVTDATARNIALQTCLPIYNKLIPEDKNLLCLMLKLFENMSFQIVKTNKKCFLASDKPVILHGSYDEKSMISKIDEVIMPISSYLLLYMKPLKKTKKEYYNRLVEINTNGINYFNSAIAQHCQRWIYSNSRFTEKQIKWIIKERGKV
ncbi:DUF4238 domain-containing protein [Ruminococcus sp. XPD3002]|uniref:DUF4238 domain-containing protein n=1 Tax=Ruminococcus sp. XPD3002 TaxID=1452269 RepID=UPI000914AE9E|nr:Protein of unknown function [Ruminococcus flavefaciens]